MNTIYGKLGGASAVEATDRELMQMALEALTEYDGTNGESKRKRILVALRERLKQPEQEPQPQIVLEAKDG